MPHPIALVPRSCTNNTAKWVLACCAVQIFERNPQELCTEIIVEDEQTQNRFHYKVQDTPGALHNIFTSGPHTSSFAVTSLFVTVVL